MIKNYMCANLIHFELKLRRHPCKSRVEELGALLETPCGKFRNHGSQGTAPVYLNKNLNVNSDGKHPFFATLHSFSYPPFFLEIQT